MTQGSFEEQDRQMMERLKPARDKKVPQEILKGFSASVEAKIREKQPSLEMRFKPQRTWLPVWAPVFAVLVIGSILVLRMPMSAHDILLTPETVELAQANTSQISDEITDLSDVGAWTEEDAKSAGIPSDSDIEELELSKAVSSPDTKLA